MSTFGIDALPLNEKTGDLAVTAGWGHAGQGGVTMLGKGSRPSLHGRQAYSAVLHRLGRLVSP